MLNANMLYLKLVRHKMLNCKLGNVKTPTIYEDSLDDFAKRQFTILTLTDIMPLTEALA